MVSVSYIDLLAFPLLMRVNVEVGTGPLIDRLIQSFLHLLHTEKRKRNELELESNDLVKKGMIAGTAAAARVTICKLTRKRVRYSVSHGGLEQQRGAWREDTYLLIYFDHIICYFNSVFLL